MEPEFLGCFSVTFPAAPEKVVLFLRTEYSKRKSVFHFQALAAIIWQKELISTNDKRGAKGERERGAKFTSPEVCVPFALSVNRPVFPCKW